MVRRFFHPTLAPKYNVAKLVPKLKYKEAVRPAKLRNPDGLLGRLKILRKTVTALFRYERIELHHSKAMEARGQAELLIVEATRNGPNHLPTMDLAKFWLEEPQLVHKLFKVFVPRYQNFDKAFTSLHIAPRMAPGETHTRAILEFKGNPFPPVIRRETPSHLHLHLHNILLNEARREFNGERVLQTSSDADQATTSFPERAEVDEELVNRISKMDLVEKVVKLDIQAGRPSTTTTADDRSPDLKR